MICMSPASSTCSAMSSRGRSSMSTLPSLPFNICVMVKPVHYDKPPDTNECCKCVTVFCVIWLLYSGWIGCGQMGSTLSGAAAKVVTLTDWEDTSRLMGVPKRSLCQKKHEICSDPISADPICLFPNQISVCVIEIGG